MSMTCFSLAAMIMGIILTLSFKAISFSMGTIRAVVAVFCTTCVIAASDRQQTKQRRSGERPSRPARRSPIQALRPDTSAPSAREKPPPSRMSTPQDTFSLATCQFRRLSVVGFLNGFEAGSRNMANAIRMVGVPSDTDTESPRKITLII